MDSTIGYTQIEHVCETLAPNVSQMDVFKQDPNYFEVSKIYSCHKKISGKRFLLRVNNPTSNSSFQGSLLQGILMNAFFLALRMTSVLEVVKCIWN